MPKRGGQRGGGVASFSGSRFNTLASDYYNHDDRRDHHKRGTRRVTFKAHAVDDKANRERLANAVRRLEDDEDMGDLASTSSKFENRRKGSPIPKGKFGNFKNKLTQSTFGWYQVTVSFGHRYSKDELIRILLKAISPDIFIPHYWRIEKNCAVFFVDDFPIATRLQSIDRGIQMPDGHRVLVRVRNNCPLVTVDDAFKERMKLAMVKRYNAQTHALDLSRFHADPDFKDMFVGLFRPAVLSAALDIIQKNVPEIEALNLNDNGISSLESFKNLSERLPNLKILYLADNRITSLAHLLVLRSIPIIDLVLKGNPLRTRYKDQSLYVSEVRKKFPKLKKLDGESLGPEVSFDLSSTNSLPAAKASYICDSAGLEIIRQFLEQYFLIFDSDNRQSLLDAYHENAMMSISVPPASQAGRLQSFWKHNRNLFRTGQNEEFVKYRLLKHTRLQIVSTLAELPKTKHDIKSFSVDLTLFMPQMIAVTVGGLFQEFEPNTASTSANNPSTSKGNNDIRHFIRHYIIVPSGSGFCIRNELIFITSATSRQARTFMKHDEAQSNNIANVQANSGINADVASVASSMQTRLQLNQPSTPIATVVIPPQVPSVVQTVDDATKLQMIQTMSTQSNMNAEWSRKCLEDTNWDFNHAITIFNSLQRENRIPPEAFIK